MNLKQNKFWFVASLTLATIALFASVLTLGIVYPQPTPPVVPLAKVCTMEIMSTTDEAMLAYVRKTVAKALQDKCAILEVEVFSPGGPVATSVEISHVLRRARQAGLIVATFGRSFVASGATIVLSAGTPGYRQIVKNSLVLVHGIQVSSGPFGSSMTCVDSKLEGLGEDDLLSNQVILQVAAEYAANTGKPLAQTLKWLRCDNSQVGDGSLAIRLGLADFLSD